jgi:hypothetical protein
MDRPRIGSGTIGGDRGRGSRSLPERRLPLSFRPPDLYDCVHMARHRYVLWIEDSDREALEVLAQRNERSLAAEVRQAMRARIVQASRSLNGPERGDAGLDPGAVGSRAVGAPGRAGP